MSKTKLLSFVVYALLVLNFAIIGYLFLSKDKSGFKGKRMPREIVIEKLHFNSNQIMEYDKIIKIHQEKIRSLDDSIRDAKNKLYQLLNAKKVNFIERDSLYLKLGNYQKQIETTHFNHFLQIKALCKKDQLSNFKMLTEELSKIFSHPRKPKNE